MFKFNSEYEKRMRGLNRLMCVFLVILLSAQAGVSSAAETLFTDQATVTPELAKPGNWPVGVQTIELTNPAQLDPKTFNTQYDRPLVVEVWYPSKVDTATSMQAAVYTDVLRSGTEFSVAGSAWRGAPLADTEEQFPLIVMSHGYTGYRSIMFYLAEHLASHGYVVASIDHTDSTNANIDFANNPGAGFASTLYNRARDQQFVMQSMMASPLFSALLQPQNAALIGYSMGGYGALNTVGGCYAFTPQTLSAMGFPEPMAKGLASVFSSCNAGRDDVDSRWKAMIAFAPWGGEQNIHTANSLADIQAPTLVVGGDLDDVSGFENGIEKLYRQIGAKSKYLMVYQNARHNIAAHPAPKAAYANDLDIGHYYEPSWNVESITRINQHMSLAFLDCHLKSKPTACDALPKRENIAQTKQEDGKLSSPWPGFKDRWGTGVRFIRGSE